MGLLFLRAVQPQLLNTAPRLLLCRLALQHLGCQFLCCGLIVGCHCLRSSSICGHQTMSLPLASNALALVCKLRIRAD